MAGCRQTGGRQIIRPTVRVVVEMFVGGATVSKDVNRHGLHGEAGPGDLISRSILCPPQITDEVVAQI